MRRLSDVYESARVNIPIADLPDRDNVPGWEELDQRVRDELEVLKANILSVLTVDTRLLGSHQRVISIFNRGLRRGYFADASEDGIQDDDELARHKPFQWGWDLARQAAEGRGGYDAATFAQFITATHLLAYEFGQLEQANSNPFELLRRSIGPQRIHEFGDSVFALPVLVNYRARLIRRVLAESGFDFGEFYTLMPLAPSHMDYLEHGLVALFDSDPESWVRAAAYMSLATQPYVGGGTIRDEDFHAPDQAALTIVRKPITAKTLIRRQVTRIEIAREWVGVDEVALAAEEDENAATLWDVYRMTPAYSIRGADVHTGDLIAFDVVAGLSAHLDEIIDSEETPFACFRRHFPAFAHGFDARYEAAIVPQALASVRRGTSVSAGLRRFESGQQFVDAVLADLKELGAIVKELYRGAEAPVDYVLERLHEGDETPVAVALHELFSARRHLAEEVFQDKPEAAFFSTTNIQTEACFDLMRAAIFYVVLAASPRARTADDVMNHLADSRRNLERLLERYGPKARRDSVAAGTRNPGRRSPQPYQVVLTRDHGDGRGEISENVLLAEWAALFLENFGTFTRLIRSLVTPLNVAYKLNKRHSIFARPRIT